MSALSRMLYGWMVYTVGGVGVLTHHNFHIPFNYGHRLRHGCKLVLKCICHVNCQITNHNSVCVCAFLAPFLLSSSHHLISCDQFEMHPNALGVNFIVTIIIDVNVQC